MKSLTKMSGALMGLLSLQFILGMIANLYVEFPDTTDQAQLWQAAWSTWSVAAHMVVALLILVLGLVIALRAKAGKVLAWLGFVGILVAALGGEEFVRLQTETWSLVMAFGFIAAMGLYGRFMAVAMQPPSMPLNQGQ